MTNDIPWQDIEAVGIRTTSDGPWAEDVFWQFLRCDGFFELPGSYVDSAAFDRFREHLPGMDSIKIIRAMGSTSERIFRIWHRDESRYRPGRDELSARFAALVARLGGEANPAVFERLHAAWSEDWRRDHGVEHLVDCLRELDAAGPLDVVELALWYHDAVYVPGARDCEERSARMLIEDAAALGIAPALAEQAAALVRATTHAHAPADATAQLMLDIDLAILGRDVLRFMDYEFSIEEEYAPAVPTWFHVRRGRFLAALLARPHIFHTDAFRARYEQHARTQLAALLSSRRYRAYRWLRWL